jgi:hypothetical protein
VGQAAVLLGFLVVICAAGVLAAVYLNRRPDRSDRGRDGLDGVRAKRTAPLPDLPPARTGLAVPADRAITVGTQAAETLPAAPPVPMRNVSPSSSPAAPVRNRINNSGFTRFGRPGAGRPEAVDGDRGGSPSRFSRA